jgi:HrpA-like RNA helicase
VFGVIKKIKEQERGKDVKVILTSATLDKETIKDFK